MTAYRLYSAGTEKHWQSLSLCHGYPSQSRYELFDDQHFIHDCTTGRLSQLAFIRKSKAWLRNHMSSIDIFHGLQGFQITVEPAWECQRSGIPSFVKIASHRADLQGSRFSRLTGIQQRRIHMLKQLEGVIAISQEIKDECLEQGICPGKIHYIPNGVDVEHFKPTEKKKSELREQLGLLDVPTIVFSGSLVQRKRPHLLVEAAKILASKRQAFQMVMVGPPNDQSYANQMSSMVNEAGLEKQVRFVGMQSDVRPFLHASDIFVLPSRNEGLPNAALEAMACGMPVILTPVSGAKDLVEKHEKCGMIVEPSGATIAESIQYLLDDQAKADEFRLSARRNCERHYAAEKILDQTISLFKQACESSRTT